MRPPARILIIAGSDSGGGAGIQGDLKTVEALGGYGMTAITALTAQNTRGVFGVHPIPCDFIAQQITLCLDDIGADAIKTGMLHSAEVIHTVVEAYERGQRPEVRGEGEVVRCESSVANNEKNTQGTLRSSSPLGGEPQSASRDAVGGSPRPPSLTPDPRPPTPLIIDPVMVAKGGSPLLQADALDALRTRLIPMATLITPNLPEAELLLGHPIEGVAAMERAAEALLKLGCAAVLLKGGHGSDALLTDILLTREGTLHRFTAARRTTRHTHGTGCAFASAIATGLGQGLPLPVATARAHGFVQAAMEAAPQLGHGHGPLGHACAGRLLPQ